MKIDISNKVPFSSLKPGDRGTIDGKPFVRIGALVDSSVSCGSVVQAVSLDDGNPLNISGDTLVEAVVTRAPEERDPKIGEVWIDIEGDYVLRVDGCEPWVDLATGIRFDDTEVEAIAPIDVKLVRA